MSERVPVALEVLSRKDGFLWWAQTTRSHGGPNCWRDEEMPLGIDSKQWHQLRYRGLWTKRLPPGNGVQWTAHGDLRGDTGAVILAVEAVLDATVVRSDRWLPGCPGC